MDSYQFDKLMSHWDKTNTLLDKILKEQAKMSDKMDQWVSDLVDAINNENTVVARVVVAIEGLEAKLAALINKLALSDADKAAAQAALQVVINETQTLANAVDNIPPEDIDPPVVTPPVTES